MAYDRTQLRMIDAAVDGVANEWAYFTTDTLATCTAANYWSDGYSLGMRVGDHVYISVVDSVSAPTSCTAAGMRFVSAVNASTGAATSGVTPA
jgi:hypothetical protein